MDENPNAQVKTASLNSNASFKTPLSKIVEQSPGSAKAQVLVNRPSTFEIVCDLVHALILSCDFIQWRITDDGKLAFTLGNSQNSQDKNKDKVSSNLKRLLGGTQNADEEVDLAALCSGSFESQVEPGSEPQESIRE